MKKVILLSVLMCFMNACGNADEGSVSAPSAVASRPNLRGSVDFKCGQGVVVVKVSNLGSVDAHSSFLRIDQSNAPSQSFVVPAVRAGQSQSLGLTVRYLKGQLDARIKIDDLNQVAESNERDNEIRLRCRG